MNSVPLAGKCHLRIESYFWKMVSFMNIKLSQSASLPSSNQVDARHHWIWLLPVSGDGEIAAHLPYAEVIQQRLNRLPEDQRKMTPVEIDLPNRKGSRLVLACLDEDADVFQTLTLARKLVEKQSLFNPAEIALLVEGFESERSETCAEALISAALAASAELPCYRSSKKTAPALQTIRLHGFRSSHGFKRAFAEARGNALARYLTQLPPNELTPTHYREVISALAKQYGWKMTFFGSTQLQKKKAGAFLAVAQGSPVDDAGIVHLQYRPGAQTRKPPVALIGKGICFDTGGVNLKPAKFMLGMHEDMEGSAVALGSLLALTELQVKFPVDCWLALATNHIGPRAYKPNDVVTAMNGTTIEVIHTDAEGRMVLADTLALASKSKPVTIIDYATLTGACVYSLGSAYSGVFSNRDGWHPALIETGRQSGERVWPFPLDKDYDKALESDIADVKQCAEEGNADHILASRFLQRFVDAEINWLHMDLSSGNHKGGLAHIPTDTTGFGVRYTVSFLLDQKLAHQASTAS